jgi:hypothetical protein
LDAVLTAFVDLKTGQRLYRRQAFGRDLGDLGAASCGLRVDFQELIDTLGERALKLSHLSGQFEVEMCRQQSIAFIGPRQGDLVEVLPDLSSERPQSVKLLCTAEQLLSPPRSGPLACLLRQN